MSKVIEKQVAKMSEVLRTERIRQELSQDELAKMAGIDRKTVNRIENNRFSPRVETFLSLCNALDIHPRSFFR